MKIKTSQGNCKIAYSFTFKIMLNKLSVTGKNKCAYQSLDSKKPIINHSLTQ